MSFTLDELLDATGVRGLRSKPIEKTASQSGGDVETGDLQKLAARCRNAAAAVDPAKPSPLREKIAAVAIYRQTLSEIRAIEEPGVTKVASVSPEIDAVFVKQALESGHDPLEIATFLEKQAFVGKLSRGIGRKWTEFGAGRLASKTKRLDAAASHYGAAASEKWKDVLRRSDHLSSEAKETLLSKLRAQVGSEGAHQIVSGAGAKSFTKLRSFKDLSKSIDEAAKAKTPSSGMFGISNKTLDKVKKPALYGAGGALALHTVTNRKQEPKRSGDGSVVVVSR